MFPSSHATFEPFPPDLNVDDLVDSAHDMVFAKRITCDAMDEWPREDYEKLVLFHVVKLGIPLVVEGFHERLDKGLFSTGWLQQNYALKAENVRDLGKGINSHFTTGYYLNNLPALTQRINSSNFNSPKLQRLYLKDIDCPSEWHSFLEQLVPPAIFYLNESPKPFNGPGSQRSRLPECPKTPQGLPIARAGDLMSSLPADMRAQNLMCYIGHEGTYTPAHQEMCASLGHNLMVEASDDSFEDGKETKAGSSLWFMTETKDRQVVAEYWMSRLGHDIDLENHFARLTAWIDAPFKTYVVEQRPGDLILVPPLAAHQVWNRGTRTMKVAWNRTTVDTLRMALGDALPQVRLLCRDEQYKNKAIIFYTLDRYSQLLRYASKADHPEVEELWKDFNDLFKLYTNILLSESFEKNPPQQSDIELVEFDSNVTCSYCRCNIFNRFLTCPWCKTGGDDPYDVCMDCYVLGRSCQCISKLKWVEQFRWKDLGDRHETWRRQIIARIRDNNEEHKARFPILTVARAQLRRKSVAEICQAQMLLRPWVDSKKPQIQGMKEETSSDSEGDDGQARKRRKVQRSKRKPKNDYGRCHMCKNSEPIWKLATCSRCKLQYCYSTLFRAFDILPQEVMEISTHWVCPKCRKICSCASCRQDSTMRPHEPDRILLGYDTRKVADTRSVESLVNMRLNNQRWLDLFPDENGRRLEKRRQEAELKRKRMLQENSDLVGSLPQVSPNGDPPETSDDHPQEIPVDPALELSSSFVGLGQVAFES